MKRLPPSSHMPSFDRTSLTLMMLGVTIMIALLSILTKPLPDPPPKLHLGVHSWRTEKGATVRFIPRIASGSFVSLRWAAFNPNLSVALEALCQQTQAAFDAYLKEVHANRAENPAVTTAQCTVNQTSESIELLLELPSDPATLRAATDLWQASLSNVFKVPPPDRSTPSTLPSKMTLAEATSAMNTWIGLVAPLKRTEAQVLIERLLKHQPAGSPQSLTHIALSTPITTPITALSLETTSATNPSFVSAYALAMHLNPFAQVTLQPGILTSRLQLTPSAKPDTLLDRIQHPPSKEVLHQYWFDWYRMSAQQVAQPKRLVTLLSSASYLGWPREHLLYWHQLWSKLTVDQLETQWLKWYEVQRISSQTLQSQAARTNIEQPAHHRR